jgi:hypothetical protein
MITVRMRRMPLLHRCSKCQCLALFCSTLLLCLLSSCAKDYFQSSREDDKAYGSNGMFTLPVNLNRYNLLSTGGGTKTSSSDTTYYINVDSLIDWHRCREMIFSEDGYVYTQVPFKSNEEGIYGVCAPKGAKNIKDSIVRIKCFYILLENYKKGERYEYLVTMIPSKQVETQGEDYDFLSKPNFTGLVIYSSLEGEYIREEIYKKGIVHSGKLWQQAEYNGTKNRTKTDNSDDVVDGGELATIVCTAYVSHTNPINGAGLKALELAIEHNDRAHMQETCSTEGKDENQTAGGGGAPAPNSCYYITYSFSSCSGIGAGKDSVSRGGTWCSPAANDNGSDCKFLFWNGDAVEHKYSRVAIIEDVASNYNVNAVYVSKKDDPDCFIVSYLFGNGEIRSMLDTLLRNTFRDNKEDGYMLGGIMSGLPVRGNTDIKFHYSQDQRFTGMYHTHPDDNVIPSKSDFYTLYNMIANFSVDKYSFSYVIAGYHELLYLQLSDWSKFQSAFGGIGTPDNIKQHWRDFLKNNGITDTNNHNFMNYDLVFKELAKFGIGYQMVPLNPSYLSPLPETGYYFMNYDNSGSYDGTYWDTTIKDCLIKYGLTK